VTLLKFERSIPEEDQEELREPEDPADEGVPVDDLPKCPDYRPSSFLEGKPRCMLTQLFYISILSTFTYLLH
jgi:hypothetical protein